MEPRDAVLARISSYIALKVDVVALLDVVGVQRAAQRQGYQGAV